MSDASGSEREKSIEGFGDDDEIVDKKPIEHEDKKGKIKYKDDEIDAEIEDILSQKDDGEDVVRYLEEGEDQEEEFEDEEDRKRRKKAKKKAKEKEREKEKHKKNKKKKKNTDEAEEDFVDGNEIEQEAKLNQLARKRKKDEELALQDEADTRRIVERMEEAYEIDVRANQEQKPAMEKLKLLDNVEVFLKNDRYQKKFCDLDIKGLEILTKWLSKLDKSPPPLSLKKKLVDIILGLPVTDEQLKNCELGKTIAAMRFDPNEDKDIKKACRSIMDKWTRVLMDLADKETVDTDKQKKRALVSVQDVHEKKLSALRKSVPRLVTTKTGHDFIKKPSQKFDINNKTEKGDEYKEAINDFKRKLGKKGSS